LDLQAKEERFNHSDKAPVIVSNIDDDDDDDDDDDNDKGMLASYLGSILRNSISAKNFSDKIASSNFGQSCTQKQQIYICAENYVQKSWI
jgi:hypothetical protein